MLLFFFQAEDGIRYLVRSRGLGDVYKRQVMDWHKRFGVAALSLILAALLAGCVTISPGFRPYLSLIHI